MKLNSLTYIILETNAALDTGNYDDIPVQEVAQHIQSGDLAAWLKTRVPEIDLSLLRDQDEREYAVGLSNIYEGYVGQERRKWGVENRGLCLLIAWTNELIQQQFWRVNGLNIQHPHP